MLVNNNKKRARIDIKIDTRTHKWCEKMSGAQEKREYKCNACRVINFKQMYFESEYMWYSILFVHSYHMVISRFFCMFVCFIIRSMLCVHVKSDTRKIKIQRGKQVATMK